jgi:hypothetical protein
LKLSLELSSKFLSKLDDLKRTRLELMLNKIRTDINDFGSCMLRDENNVLPLCVVPYYEDKLIEINEMGEFSHKAPVLLDRFYENFTFDSWDLTTKMVSTAVYPLVRLTQILRTPPTRLCPSSTASVTWTALRSSRTSP